MADQPSIFDSNSGTNPPVTPPNSNGGTTPPVNDYANLLSSIKNERGEQKYATLEQALIGLQNAQNFIPQLQATQAEKDAEIERLRKEAERVKALEEAVAALTSRQNDPAPQGQPAFDENKLADLVNQTLSKRETEALQKANVASVVSVLQQSFGADAEKKFYDKAVEMGLTMPEMNALAAKSPKLVLSALGVTNTPANKPNTTPTSGSVNTSAFTPKETTFVRRNPTSALVGASTQEVNAAFAEAKQMVDELHAQGKSVHDLTDPKVFFKHFK